MSTFWNWMLILGGAALILLEVMMGGFAGFDLVLIGSAFVLGGALGLYLQNLYLGMFVAGVLCAAYILVGRRWVRRRLMLKTGGHKSGADAAIGRKAIVVAGIARHRPGRVRVNDEEWRAALSDGAGTPIQEGTEVTVTGVDGVTLLVR
jgi:membrane protein implicated in regulation of membrane protease activity